MLDFFLFLGIVPGTSFVITFNEIVLVCLITTCTAGLAAYRKNLKAKKVPLHERPVHEQLILSHPMNLDFKLRFPFTS